MKKVKVKFLEPIAIMGDPKPREVLDALYSNFAEGLRHRDKPPSEASIKASIEQKKINDRYSEPRLGFARDTAWKIGDEAMINAELAFKWENAGICLVIDEKKAAA